MVTRLMAHIMSSMRSAVKAHECRLPSLICKNPSCTSTCPLWFVNRLSSDTMSTSASSGASERRARPAGTREAM